MGGEIFRVNKEGKRKKMIIDCKKTESANIMRVCINSV